MKANPDRPVSRGVKRAFLVAAAVGLLSVAVEDDGAAGAAGNGSTGDGAGFGGLLTLAALAGAALLARRHGP